MSESRNVIEALDRIRHTLEGQEPGGGGYRYPQLAAGPVEKVLAFNNDETIKLVVQNPPNGGKGKGSKPPDPDQEIGYFSSHGILTDLDGHEIPGSKVETTFPASLKIIGGTEQYPKEQPRPFDRPPLDPEATTDNGYSKQAYFFEDGYFVTVGPSLPKIVRLKGGAAQFWVGSIGVITQGTGAFEGAKGVATYVGSAYLPKWPEKFEEQAAILAQGFSARIGTFVKYVPKRAQ